MPNKVVFLHLSEPDGVQPSDAAGNLEDLAPTAVTAAPLSVPAWTGAGRQFIALDSHALVANDKAGRDTLLVRDMTIQAILAIDLTADMLVLLARGTNDGTASQRHSFGVELEEQVGFPGYIECRWFWQDSTGAIKVQPPAVWRHLGDGKFFLLTMTRRWESTTKVVTRVYVGGEMISEITTTDGDIAGGTTGTMTIGGRMHSGVWEHFFNGTIDELLITDHEMSPEEVRHTWRRLSEFQPAGLDMFVGLIPPGLPWARDLGNSAGRHVRHAGESIGFALAGAEELRAMVMPDAAPLGVIERWERICGLTARPRDSLDVRRARVVGYLSREEGFRREAVQETLAGLVGISPEIIEFSNTQTDSFATLDTTERWIAGDIGTWSIVSGVLRGVVPIATDVRWNANMWGAHLRMPVDNGGSVKGLYTSAKLVAHSAPASAGCGLLLANRRTGDAIYFGIFNEAGTTKLVYRTIAGYVPGANVVLATPAAATYWLRLAPATNGVVGSFRFQWSTTGPDSGFSELDNVAIGLTDLDWCGFGAWGDSSSLAAAMQVDFDDFLVHAPGSSRPFNWYAYVDPALSPNPDIIGARALVTKTKPAHTHATVIQRKSLLAGNARDGLVGRGPCGGF